ncbi:YrdB family protein [Microbacterium indicum]|uniref:YrdB family protein n=1 Tax=Microbacterium indicum TaxID=358100 RepID=UPI00040FEE01|nr:YrdB family protein [Microbacterium indicum]
MSDSTAPTPGVDRPRITLLDVLRLLSELLAFGSLALWGFFAWPQPWAVVFGIATPVVAILVWAFFLSPKAVIAVPSYVRALIELVIFASATVALWALSFPWAGLAVGVFCVAVGLLVGRRRLR